jgi:putative membrane-bound dehydrogenase-like protein
VILQFEAPAPRIAGMARSVLPFFLCLLPSFLQAEFPAANDEVLEVMRNFQGRGRLSGDTPPTPPTEAGATFTLREGLVLDLMAAEPGVEQPLHMSWDSRGRLWVTLYKQYPYPAGLKIVSYDHHLRAVFDKTPEPPPHGVKGADQVVILSDSNGDGRLDSRAVVIDGLNIATASLKGAGGIWVLNPPYLLFYPDFDNDDVPDGDPEVRLSGFGLEDTHAVANSLTFGPDGWLYGANGSTTIGNVSSKVTKDVRFEGQHIWRYHPRTHVFEIFAEGGGNTFSLEIDSKGRLFSGSNGSDRGMHYDQGMSGVKNFGKHGPARNPYAFGHFEHLETQSDGKRFSMAFCIYEGGDPDLMKTLGGRIVAPNSLHHFVYVSRLGPFGSTFKIEDDPNLLESADNWFRPVDVKIGPDGGIWMADWYDSRLSHASPVDDWHKSSGRIYRVRSDTPAAALGAFDLHAEPLEKLVEYLHHPNKWFRRQAALELHWRDGLEVIPELQNRLRDEKNPHSIDALFAIHMLGGLDDDLALELLSHSDPYIRRWVVRCLGDEGKIDSRLADSLLQLAVREEHPEVRAQLLCSLKRLPAGHALPILRVMMTRDHDLTDPRLPLLLWWALEAKAETDREALLALFEEPSVWTSRLAREYAARNLARRWALAGGSANFHACAVLLEHAPTEAIRTLIVEGIASVFRGSPIPELPKALRAALDAHLKTLGEDDLLLAVMAGHSGSAAKALAVITDRSAPVEKRIGLLEALADAGNPELPPVLRNLLRSSDDLPMRRAALQAASRFADITLAQTVIENYESRFAGDPLLRDSAHRLLAGRRESAALFLDEVGRWRIKAAEVAIDVVHQMRAYRDPVLDARLDKHWPPTDSLMAEDELEEIQRIKGLLALRPGDPEAGREIYRQRCAACHQLFGEGGASGPDLTGYERGNLDFWLPAIISPSAEIREGFGAYTAKLHNDRLLLGMIERQDATGLVLRDLSGQKHLLPVSDIVSLDASPMSLMPPGLLDGLSDDVLRDLFAYLCSE